MMFTEARNLSVLLIHPFLFVLGFIVFVYWKFSDGCPVILLSYVWDCPEGYR